MSVGCPPMGVTEHPTGEVDALAPGVGVLDPSLPQPARESAREPTRSAAPAERAAQRWGVSGGAAANARLTMRECPP